ncbi:hypothetical protein KSP39_PZI002581 [Platanthera zijinensis]|uniref:Uncharacterized protein n=1 Tax=Platanthera zijinensis TaxID=2320716 RepID=A0AAP0GED1_9ASPA
MSRSPPICDGWIEKRYIKLGVVLLLTLRTFTLISSCQKLESCTGLRDREKGLHPLRRSPAPAITRIGSSAAFVFDGVQQPACSIFDTRSSSWSIQITTISAFLAAEMLKKSI